MEYANPMQVVHVLFESFAHSNFQHYVRLTFDLWPKSSTRMNTLWDANFPHLNVTNYPHAIMHREE